MTEDLVKRLRAEDPECGLRHSIAMEAADRIEALEAALRKIANEDFRGPMPSGVLIALKALAGREER